MTCSNCVWWESNWESNLDFLRKLNEIMEGGADPIKLEKLTWNLIYYELVEFTSPEAVTASHEINEFEKKLVLALFNEGRTSVWSTSRVFS